MTPSSKAPRASRDGVGLCRGSVLASAMTTSSVTEEQRRSGQKGQDLVCTGFMGNGTSGHDIKARTCGFRRSPFYPSPGGDGFMTQYIFICFISVIGVINVNSQIYVLNTDFINSITKS